MNIHLALFKILMLGRTLAAAASCGNRGGVTGVLGGSGSQRAAGLIEVIMDESLFPGTKFYGVVLWRWGSWARRQAIRCTL